MELPAFTTEDKQAVERAIRTRRTVQVFRPGLVERELVEQAVEAARWAPNHKNTEPWRFRILGPESAARLVELNTELVRMEKGLAAAANKQARWEAIPHWLLITCVRSEDAIREKEDYAACCCAALNLMTLLWTRGVGMKWTTGPVTKEVEFYEIVDLNPEEEFVVGLFMYGLPAEMPRQRRRPIVEHLTHLP